MNEAQTLDFIRDYVSHPSISTDPAYSEGMQGAREFMAEKLRALGFTVENVATPLHPIILAERGADHPEWPHLLIYGHYDVQPADPLHLWTSGPFAAEVRGRRIYGRGTADNKGPQAVQYAALSRLLASQPDLPLRITWLIEGEEEMGSPSFAAFLQQYGKQLGQAGMIVFSDTGCPGPEQMAITLGLRGLCTLELTVTGPSQDLHSGVHGGAVYNPIQALAEICASLHNPDGTVNIPGFYDGITQPVDWECDALKQLSQTEAEYRKFLGVETFHTPPGLNPFEAVRFAPTLEFNGISGGYQGAGDKTVIPSKASVKISCRLVPPQDPDRIQKLLTDTLLERAPSGVKVDIRQGHGGAPYAVVPPGKINTPADQPPMLAKAFGIADGAIENIWGTPPVYLREGGSVPIIAQMKQATGLDCLMLGLFTAEDNLHAPDESFHLDIIERATRLYQTLFEGLADQTK